jgi:hypothetical protein
MLAGERRSRNHYDRTASETYAIPVHSEQRNVPMAADRSADNEEVVVAAGLCD